MEFELGKDYTWDQIYTHHGDDYEVEENEISMQIGESVVWLRSTSKDEVYTFLMSAYNQAAGAYYRLVYSDAPGKPMLEPIDEDSAKEYLKQEHGMSFDCYWTLEDVFTQLDQFRSEEGLSEEDYTLTKEDAQSILKKAFSTTEISSEALNNAIYDEIQSYYNENYEEVEGDGI